MAEANYEDECLYCWGDPSTTATLVDGRLKIGDESATFHDHSGELRLTWPFVRIRGVQYQPTHPVDIDAAAGGSVDAAQDIAIHLAFERIPDPAISISLEDPQGVYEDGFDIRLVFEAEYRAKVMRNRIERLISPRYHENVDLRDDRQDASSWERVDRTLTHLRFQLARTASEEQFQNVGLTCRELIISVAQAVYDHDKHGDAIRTEDGPGVSPTDAKRMLDAFFATELAGRSDEAVRRYARATLVLANDLQHRRSADWRAASLCSEAAISLANIVAIVSGRHRSGECPSEPNSERDV